MTNISADTPIPFAGETLDHAEYERSEEQLQAMVKKKSARAILLFKGRIGIGDGGRCLLYTSPSPRDLSTSRMPSSA